MQKDRSCLVEWVKLKHGHQKIKSSSDPYFFHLLAVAKMVAHISPFSYEIGLCYDLLEDTDVELQEFQRVLSSCGYSDSEVEHIKNCVVELTDEYTKLRYPQLTKKQRKKKEAKRLIGMSCDSQTIKYADLIYNAGWMMEYDRKHAKKYLLKKRMLVLMLDRGDQQLQRQALMFMDKCLLSFSFSSD